MTKLLNFSANFTSWQSLRQWNLDRITVIKILRCLGANGCKKRRNKFKIVVLAQYFEQRTNWSRKRRKISQSRRSSSWRNQLYLPFLIKQNNYGVKQGTVCQIMKIVSQFSRKLSIQFWKYFHSMLLGSVVRGYCKNIQCQNFWPISLARLPQRL